MYIVYFTFLQYMCARYKSVLWWHHLTHLKFTHTSKSVWNISYFRPPCIGFGPEEIVIVLITNLLIFLKTFCIKKNRTSFLCQPTILDSAFWSFYHREQWRGAKMAGKECWGPCHGMIPSLWDFAQNYSLQIELRNQIWRGTFCSLDSEKAIDPCISKVEKAQYAEFSVPTCGKVAVSQLCRGR